MQGADGLHDVTWLKPVMDKLGERVAMMGDMVWLNDQGKTILVQQISPRCVEVRAGGSGGASVIFLQRGPAHVPIMARWTADNGNHRHAVAGRFNEKMLMVEAFDDQTLIMEQAEKVKRVLQAMIDHHGGNLERMML